MGAISFLYNLSEKSLTLADEERAQYFPATVRSAANKIDSRSPSPNTPGLPELQQFASQVSGFFGSFVREVKTLSTDAAGKVEGFVSRLGKQTGVEDDDEESAEFPGNTSGQRPRATAAAARREAEEEDYELQMALALSLSLQDTERIDPDTVKELEMEGVNVDALLAPSPDVETPKVDIDATKKTDLDKPELPTMSSEELLDDIRDAVQEVPENRDTVEEVHEDTGESGQEDPKDIMETVQDEAEPPSQSSSENKSSRRKK